MTCSTTLPCLVHRHLVTCSTTLPCFTPLRHWEPPLPMDERMDQLTNQPTNQPTNRPTDQPTENDKMNIRQELAAGNGCKCSTTVQFQVSFSSSNPFYRLSDPFLPFTDLFRQGPRDPSASIASGPVVFTRGLFPRNGAGKRSKGRTQNFAGRCLASCSSSLQNFMAI